MEQKDFLKQYKDQVEFIGKDGIVGIMKSARFEINKKVKNNRYERQKSENIISSNRNGKVNNNNKLEKKKFI